MMTGSPTEHASCESIGLGDGEFCRGAGVAILEVPIEWNRFCDGCESVQLFIARERTASSLVAQCTNCSEWISVPLTRMESEAQ